MTVILKLLIVGAVTGIVAIVLGGVLGFLVLPDKIDDDLKDKVRLELSEAYRNWETAPYDVTTKFYFFDVENHKNVMTGSDPKLKQVGPVVYIQKRQKENIQHDATTDSFTYKQRVTHTYDTESPVKNTEPITTLNVLKYFALQYAEQGQIVDTVLEALPQIFPDTEENSLFHKISIKSLLTDGYECCRLDNIPSGLNGIAAKLLRATIVGKLENNIRFQPTVENSYTFSLFKHKQNYIENSYGVYGGHADISNQSRLNSVNGKSSVEFWPNLDDDNYCNLIRGTDSYTFPPNIDVDHGISIYNPDLCRSLDFAFTEEVEVKEITGQRMIMKSENFATPSVVAENNCFCIGDQITVNGTIETECAPNGFVNLTKCYGIPIIASQPHFLYADAAHSTLLELKPTVEEHVSFLDIQPESGSLLQAIKRTQYNVMLQRIEGFSAKYKPVMLPLFWVEEIMEIPSESVDALNDVYLNHLVMIEGVKWGLLGLGAMLLLGCAGTFIFSKLRLNKKS